MNRIVEDAGSWWDPPSARGWGCSWPASSLQATWCETWDCLWCIKLIGVHLERMKQQEVEKACHCSKTTLCLCFATYSVTLKPFIQPVQPRLLSEDLALKDLPRLYKAADAFVLPSRGWSQLSCQEHVIIIGGFVHIQRFKSVFHIICYISLYFHTYFPRGYVLRGSLKSLFFLTWSLVVRQCPILAGQAKAGVGRTWRPCRCLCRWLQPIGAVPQLPWCKDIAIFINFPVFVAVRVNVHVWIKSLTSIDPEGVSPTKNSRSLDLLLIAIRSIYSWPMLTPYLYPSQRLLRNSSRRRSLYLCPSTTWPAPKLLPWAAGRSPVWQRCGGSCAGRSRTRKRQKSWERQRRVAVILVFFIVFRFLCISLGSWRSVAVIYSCDCCVFLDGMFGGLDFRMFPRKGWEIHRRYGLGSGVSAEVDHISCGQFAETNNYCYIVSYYCIHIIHSFLFLAFARFAETTRMNNSDSDIVFFLKVVDFQG